MIERDEAVQLLDLMDECAWSAAASAATRSQVMRSNHNSLKAVPFQPFKDSSGSIRSDSGSILQIYMVYMSCGPTPARLLKKDAPAKDASEKLLDDMDEFALVASTAV